MREKYELTKSAKVGDNCVCPSCGTEFEKTNYQQAFCKSKGKTVCKDKYWNTVTPEKRNNKTRISPASRAFTAARLGVGLDAGFDPAEYEHPFSSEAHGQWND
jgi:hypothetical protein